jgi:ABC-type uncharacterized transport system substrate-binding protein
MRSLLFISIFSLIIHAQSILVINSNAEIKKYRESVEEFSKNFESPFKVLDIADMSSARIQEYLYDEYPDIVYAVGAKAYQYANNYLPEKEIYFSSIVDYKRLSPIGKRFGVSNELHNGMQLTLIRSIFDEIKTIGVIYSEYSQYAVDDLAQNAEKLGIQILSLKIDEASVKSIDFTDTIKRSDAMMVIPDPLFLNDEKAVEKLFKLSNAYKKPVFAYHELFIHYGASLVISVDDSTIGRQIAAMMQGRINGEKIEKVQYPAGTRIIFNKKEASRLGLKAGSDVSFFVTEILE